MPKDIEGISFERNDDHAVCHIEFLSAPLKELIRTNLRTICHGSHVADCADEPLFGYEATLASFLERYDAKAATTQIGMMGEFLSHILITELFDEFDVVSAFFNLEEKSIKKGFDLLLYKKTENSVWISEVKSGNLHKGKTHDQTTNDLLNTAKSDLVTRLNAQEKMYWYNAVNSVRCSLHDDIDYKKTLIKILNKEGSATVQNKAVSNDNYVVLISNLFEPLGTKVSLDTAKRFINKTSAAKSFEKIVVFCVQKETYSTVIDFLKNEVVLAKLFKALK